MGYMRHHAIIVTSFDSTLLSRAHVEAARIFGVVSAIVDSPVNGYSSFFVPPDGSKEWWKESDAGDARRAEFIAYLHAQAYDDGSNALAWVAPWYGDDECKVGIESDGDEKQRGLRE